MGPLERVCRYWVIFAKLSMLVMRLLGISMCFPAQTKLWQVMVVVSEQALGCCGLGPAEALGQLQRIAGACGARLAAVAEAARIVMLWNKLV